MARRGINKVSLIGNLGQDPIIRYTDDNIAIANLSMATSETWKDRKTGNEKSHTEWHRVTIFGKLAEIAGEYLKTGSKIYIEGKLHTKKWQDNSGVDRYTTSIVVISGGGGVMQMLDSKSDEEKIDHNKNNALSNDPLCNGIDWNDEIPF